MQPANQSSHPERALSHMSLRAFREDVEQVLGLLRHLNSFGDVVALRTEDQDSEGRESDRSGSLCSSGGSGARMVRLMSAAESAEDAAGTAVGA